MEHIKGGLVLSETDLNKTSYSSVAAWMVLRV